MPKQKNRFNAKYLAILIPIIVIAIAAYYLYGSTSNSSSNKGIIGNKQALDEISRLLLLSSQKTLTTLQLISLSQIVSAIQVGGGAVASTATQAASSAASAGVGAC